MHSEASAYIGMACVPNVFFLLTMGCQEVHAVTLLAFVCGTASISGLFAATLLPQWRLMKLYTFNRNEKNLTVSIGLWVKCTRLEWSRDCMIYDTEWYASVDQLDIRVLQFALPFSILTGAAALILCLTGICNTTFSSTVPSLKLVKCLVNSSGCHLVAGMLFCLADANAPTSFLYSEAALGRFHTSVAPHVPYTDVVRVQSVCRAGDSATLSAVPATGAEAAIHIFPAAAFAVEKI
ncbi:unnamed protein product [Ranitomeya imitator]|uniref:Claudin n=1 Tax=Ranitomeya imitator TaxID=111125 RepID=A0ABN9L1M6_9NEOB|nr:unnamed protein product [Ranitomeya imitator]